MAKQPAHAKEGLSLEQVKDLFADPFYCLGAGVHHAYTIQHPPMVTEEEWIKCALRAIEEDGAEEFLKRMLRNLKGEGSHWMA